jgi:hypothetical protein
VVRGGLTLVKSATPPSGIGFDVAAAAGGVGVVGERPNPRKPIPGKRFMGFSEFPRFRIDSTMGGLAGDAGAWSGDGAGFSAPSSAKATFLLLLTLRLLSVLLSRAIFRPPIRLSTLSSPLTADAPESLRFLAVVVVSGL